MNGETHYFKIANLAFPYFIENITTLAQTEEQC